MYIQIKQDDTHIYWGLLTGLIELCRNDEEELPPAGLTKNLLSAFKDLQRSGQNVSILVQKI